MVTRSRRGGHLIEAMAGTALGAVALAAVWFGAKPIVFGTTPFVHATATAEAPTAAYGASYPASAAAVVTSKRPSQIPVLSYHQLNNGCSATAAMCNRTGTADEILTTAQFYAEMKSLHEQGYHSITASAYTRWAAHEPVLLPSKPILLTVDDGIENFFGAATPVLRHFGYSMVAMIVSGFATGAQNGQQPYAGFDASWTQLRQLDPSIWSFAFHAGPQGHLESTSQACPYFYPCQRPGETDEAYQARVRADINTGVSQLQSELPGADTQMWAVPYNDLAQEADEPQSGTEPSTWLSGYAQQNFAVVFVDGLRSSANEHYRYEVHGTDSLRNFTTQLNTALAAGSFTDTSGTSGTAGSD
jgi:Polysaccharide deacetylase